MLNFEALTPVVETAAGIAASNFPAHHDIADVKQDIWVWIMSNREAVGKMIRRQNDASDQALLNILVKVGNSSLKGEDGAVYAYSEEDTYYYSLDLIKSILEVVFNHEDWQSFAVSQDAMPRAKSDPATSGNNIASYIDVSRAVSQLPDEQYNLIVWRYKYGYTFEQVGAEVGITRQAARERLETAVKAIQRFLGQRELSELRKGYEGRTEPRNIASSQARVENDYNG